VGFGRRRVEKIQGGEASRRHPSLLVLKAESTPFFRGKVGQPQKRRFSENYAKEGRVLRRLHKTGHVVHGKKGRAGRSAKGGGGGGDLLELKEVFEDWKGSKEGTTKETHNKRKIPL